MNITDAIIEFLYIVFGKVLDLLPTGDGLSNDYIQAITDLLGGILSWENFFPAVALVVVIQTILVVEGFILIFRLSVFIYDKIRGSG